MINLLAQEIKIAPKAGVTGADFSNLTTNVSFSSILSGGISLILIIAAILFFFMLVIGGIRWIMSGGDKGQTEAARNQITAALVGLVIVFAAWAIAQLIGGLFGINIFGGAGFSLPTLTK